jgi:tetratricopeptide (TPR) repeat protein
MTTTEIEDFVGKGNTALANDNLVDARRCFEMALKRDPLNAGVHNKLSLIHWKLGNPEAALNHLTQALEWDPNDREVIIHCCDVFRAMDKAQDAVEILNAYLERNPWDHDLKQRLEGLSGPDPSEGQRFDIAQFFTEQGEQQLESGRPDRARVCFEMALEHNPNHAKAYGNLGVLTWQEGDLEHALEHLHKAMQLDPQDFDVLYNSSKALAAAGELDTATDLLRLYLQQNPKDDAVWKDYDALLRQNGGSQWKPDNLPAEVTDVYIRMGEALGQAQDVLGAGEAFQKALQLDPTRVEPYYLLGRLHQKLGQDYEALAIFREGLRFHPEHRESVIMAGKILLSQEQQSEARGLCEAYASKHEDADPQAVWEEIVNLAGQEGEGRKVTSEG